MHSVHKLQPYTNVNNTHTHTQMYLSKQTRSENYLKRCTTAPKWHGVDNFLLFCCCCCYCNYKIHWTRFLATTTVTVAIAVSLTFVLFTFLYSFLHSYETNRMSENSFRNQYLYGKRDANNKNNMPFCANDCLDEMVSALFTAPGSFARTHTNVRSTARSFSFYSVTSVMFAAQRTSSEISDILFLIRCLLCLFAEPKTENVCEFVCVYVEMM